MAIWVSFLLYGDQLSLLGYFSAQDWHIHEMLFGFSTSCHCRFFTNRHPQLDRTIACAWYRRLPLLAGVWLAGRLAILLSGFVSEGLLRLCCYDRQFVSGVTFAILILTAKS